jgi:hypothetical protein
MKLFTRMKDGGPESRVTGHFLIESKSLFSIALLKFEDGSREAFHSHAFNAWSWVLKGHLIEEVMFKHTASGGGWLSAQRTFHYLSSFRAIFTGRNRFHKVSSIGTTWALTFRGPWVKEWNEFLPAENQLLTLTNGRKVVARAPA